ncbi:MAG: FAD-dependent thymidylate synthase [Christensenella sp.]|nr:FAD-dependent thymidylate synthase [Christensenella sp.]
MARTTLKTVLLSATPDPELIVSMGAKLCYSKADIGALQKTAKSEEFIDRLTQMGHLSPIEHASFTFGVEGVSRALLAQITRHRIASFSVQSQRYVNQSEKKESFSYIIPPSIEALGKDAVAKFEEQMAIMQGWYDEWVCALGGKGEKSNEDARFVLPNACETKMIITMNARELLHFFNLRCCNRAQWEIRELAWQMLALTAKKAPGLFKSAGPSCVCGACGEGRMTCGKAAEVREKHKKLMEDVNHG